MKKKPIKNSANDLYDIYKFPEELHLYKNSVNITLGICDLATEEDCFWILDVIVENQSLLPNTGIQIWELARVEGDTFDLTCSDENGANLFMIKNPKFEFYFDYLKIIKKDNLIYLPIEKNLY
ncbi:hypothetical protein MKJ01_18200 [Chryseobacterium sp. SSA4.19]|uniref:DUF6876 family protein n=1 Tax=Chryseobacterium sp. SSA4.19 TaxID=2919915 RepID=UPI001F4EC645|nr:DUF6876 family protein [Chryseobacterium sp. SSA4.19]MCJ8155690.1 hypothetical protein [Chryseobacterium sp. SSA4.19]